MIVPEHVDARFRDAATTAGGALDIAFELVDSPLGQLLIARSSQGVCRISFEGEGALDSLAEEFGPRVLRSPRPLAPAARQLREYFEGRRQAFDLDLDLSPLALFQRHVLEELVRVPYGETSTYGGLAARIGRPRAARAVGGALNRNPIPIVIPCHRIVGSTGTLVGYAGGLERKRFLLELEQH